MNIVDLALIILVLVGAFSGYRDGFILSVFSLVAVIIGVLLGFKLMGYAIAFLIGRFEINSQLLPFVAFGMVFILVVIFVNILGRALKAAVNATLFGAFDQVAGGLFGVLKTIFMISVSLWIAESMNLKVPETWSGESRLLGFTADVAPATSKLISSLIPYFSNTF